MTKTLATRRFFVRAITSIFAIIIFACLSSISADAASVKTGFMFTKTECSAYSDASESDIVFTFSANTKLFCYDSNDGYSRVYVNGRVGYILNENLSEERTWTENRFEDYYANKNGVKMYVEADENSELVSVLNINNWVIVNTDNGEWAYVSNSGRKGYVKMENLSASALIANGYVADESISEADRERVNEYMETYFSCVPEIWEEFCKNGWEYHITNQPVSEYLEDAEIETQTELPDNMCGLTVLKEKTIVSSVKGRHLEIAVIHELGHYVFRCWLTAGDRTEFSKIYNDFIKRQLNDIAEYTYTDHCIENASEFFAESFQRYLIGIVEYDGDASEIENLTPEVRDFIEAHI